MITVGVGLLLILGAIRALGWLIAADRESAERCAPTTGDPVWDAFLAETGEIPPHSEVLPWR